MTKEKMLQLQKILETDVIYCSTLFSIAFGEVEGKHFSHPLLSQHTESPCLICLEGLKTDLEGLPLLIGTNVGGWRGCAEHFNKVLEIRMRHGI